MTLTISEHTIPFAAQAGEELFAIADVHGRSELLAALFETIAATERVPGLQRTVVLLGDLIDRGPDSLGCIDLAIASKQHTGADAVDALCGNHEQMLLTAIIQDDQTLRRHLGYRNWMANGGTKVVEELLDQGHSARTPADIQEALGPQRLLFLEGLSSHRTSGEIMFVHAGLNPFIDLTTFLSEPIDVDFSRLEEDDHWAWIRGPFLEHKPSEHGKRGHHGYFVVHGHTPPAYEVLSLEEQLAHDRLNLDGGSYGTGRARMARIIGSEVTFYEVGA